MTTAQEVKDDLFRLENCSNALSYVADNNSFAHFMQGCLSVISKYPNIKFVIVGTINATVFTPHTIYPTLPDGQPRSVAAGYVATHNGNQHVTKFLEKHKNVILISAEPPLVAVVAYRHKTMTEFTDARQNVVKLELVWEYSESIVTLIIEPRLVVLNAARAELNVTLMPKIATGVRSSHLAARVDDHITLDGSLASGLAMSWVR